MAKIDKFDSFDSFEDVDDLLAMVIPDDTADTARAYALFINFLDARLANIGWTVNDLARKLDVKVEWVIALLNGTIPPSRLSDDMLARIAQAIDYEPNLLRVMLNRDFTPAVDSAAAESDSYSDEIEWLLDKIAEYLLERVDQRYAERHRADRRKTRHHDYVIKQIEMIVERHRTDIKMVEILIDEPKVVAKAEDDLGRDIQRLIQHIKANA
jgi:transcriptional regulator with XRE-family HTH domain